jgi:hypothetical protein
MLPERSGSAKSSAFDEPWQQSIFIRRVFCGSLLCIAIGVVGLLNVHSQKPAKLPTATATASTTTVDESRRNFELPWYAQQALQLQMNQSNASLSVIQPSGERPVGKFCDEAKRRSQLEVIDNLIQQYISEHNVTVAKGDIASGLRRYVLAPWWVCPINIGNTIHAFLNSFIVAIITNRTLLWPTTKKDCHHVLWHRSWVAEAQLILPRLKHSFGEDAAFLQSTPFPNVTERQRNFLDVTGLATSVGVPSMKQLYCTDFSSAARVMHVGLM